MAGWSVSTYFLENEILIFAFHNCYHKILWQKTKTYFLNLLTPRIALTNVKTVAIVWRKEIIIFSVFIILFLSSFSQDLISFV